MRPGGARPAYLVGGGSGRACGCRGGAGRGRGLVSARGGGREDGGVAKPRAGVQLAGRAPWTRSTSGVRSRRREKGENRAPGDLSIISKNSRDRSVK